MVLNALRKHITLIKDSPFQKFTISSECGTGKVAQQLRAILATPEDQSLVSNNHVRWLTTTCNTDPGNPALF